MGYNNDEATTEEVIDNEEQNQEETAELTPEQAAQEEAHAEAAFEAGFTGEELPANPDESESRQDESSNHPDDNGASEEAAAEEEAKILAGYSESELKSLLEKANKFDELSEKLTTAEDRMAGRYGEIQRTIKELQEKEGSTGKGIKLTAEMLQRTSEEYPELAELIAEDLSEALGSSELPDDDFDARLKPHVDELSSEFDRRLEARLLSHYRPNWIDEQKTDEFSQFKSQLSPKELETYETSWNADEINGYFKKFDEWKEQQAEKSQQADDENKASKSEKSNRLAAAMVPRGAPATDHAPSDDDAFEAGFKTVRGVG